MKCIVCNKRECEHSETTLCAACDRDEWRDATISANKRLQDAEDMLRLMSRYLVNEKLVAKYPCNYQDLLVELQKLRRR